MRHYRVQKHLEVVQREPRTVLIIQIKQSVEVELATGCLVLKEDHDNEAESVAQNYNPVHQLEANVVAFFQLGVRYLLILVLTRNDVVIDENTVLEDGEGAPDPDKTHALELKERVVACVTDTIQ